MKRVGIDPALRHVGLAVVEDGKEPVFHEIKAKGDVLTAAAVVQRGLLEFFGFHGPFDLWCIEKQLSVGGRSSALMFYMQMLTARCIERIDRNPRMVAPLPVQLQSYIRKRHGIPADPASQMVRGFQEQFNYQRRISQHCVDAFFLTELGKDVLAGEWYYKPPSKEQPLFPWEIEHGNP